MYCRVRSKISLVEFEWKSFATYFPTCDDVVLIIVNKCH